MKVLVPLIVEIDPARWDLTHGTGDGLDLLPDVRFYVADLVNNSAEATAAGIIEAKAVQQ